MDVSRYLDLFVHEATEHLEALGRDLVALEREACSKTLASAFRHAHSIKGMAASMGFSPIADLAHGLEDLLDQARKGATTLGPDSMDVALRAADTVTRLVEDVAEKRPLDASDSDVARLLARLRADRHDKLGGMELPGELSRRSFGKAASSGNVRTVRVRTDVVDGLMDGIGELLLATDRLRQAAYTAEQPSSSLSEAVDGINRIGKSLYQRVLAARMIPLSTLTDRLPRALREASRSLGKEVVLETDGTDIELDRSVLDEIESPLGHLVRNCVDHGIEAPEERRRNGKPVTGKVKLSARRDRDRVIVHLSDDGRGFDASAIAASAVEKGVVDSFAVRRLSSREVVMLACEPGLSTTESVSEVSGRGVGLDVAKSSIESIGGSFEIESVKGEGSTFVLSLPLTVAIQRLLLVEVEGETFGMPVSRVLRVLEIEPGQEQRSNSSRKVPLFDDWVDAYELSSVLRMAETRQGRHCGNTGGRGAGSSPNGSFPYVIVEPRPGKLAALEVHGLTGHLQGMVRPLEWPVSMLGAFSGVSLLPDGKPILVLDLASILRTAETGA